MDLDFLSNFINQVTEEYYYYTRFDNSVARINCSSILNSVNLNFNPSCSMIIENRCYANVNKSLNILIDIIKKKIRLMPIDLQKQVTERLKITNLDSDLRQSDFIKKCVASASTYNTIRIQRIDYTCRNLDRSGNRSYPTIKIINTGSSESDCIFDSFFEALFNPDLGQDEEFVKEPIPKEISNMFIYYVFALSVFIGLLLILSGTFNNRSSKKIISEAVIRWGKNKKNRLL